MQQLTEEWRLARCGKVTASRISDLMARTKSGYSASRTNYLAELLTERLTGRPVEGYTNAAMEWGVANESAARVAYELAQNVMVEEVGFIPHPLIANTGASPDGLVGDLGLVEIKAPQTATHLDTLLNESVPDKYVKQMNWQMACTGRHWCDFVSFDPRLPAKMQLFVKRFDRDAGLMSDMESEIKSFLKELDAKLSQLRQRFGEAA